MKYIWLSHIIEKNTPLYGGEDEGVRIEQDKSINAGDSCNTSKISMPAHAGTHVDAPRHFITNGQCIDGYEANDWIFKNPTIVHIQVDPDQIIQTDHFLGDLPEKTDICIIKTGFEKFRGTDRYWAHGPGISPDVAMFLRTMCPGLKAIGVDFISISSLGERFIGRQAHRAFLERGIRIMEDMKLGDLGCDDTLEEIICLPMRILNADGAPCSIIGII